MSVVVMSPPTATTYREWDPLAQQVREPDTIYLMDLDTEEQRTTLAEGRLIGGNEAFGGAPFEPYWMGGTKVARVSGRYTDGVKCIEDTTYGVLALPGVRLPPGAGTIEMFVQADEAWSDLANQVPFQLMNDARQYIRLLIDGGGGVTLRADYRHQQDPGGEIDLSPFEGGLSYDADEWVSLALTFDDDTMKTYIDGELTMTTTGCLPPRFWGDSWAGGYGLVASVGSLNLAVSDLRLSRLTRVPGEVPVP